MTDIEYANYKRAAEYYYVFPEVREVFKENPHKAIKNLKLTVRDPKLAYEAIQAGITGKKVESNPYLIKTSEVYSKAFKHIITSNDIKNFPNKNHGEYLRSVRKRAETEFANFKAMPYFYHYPFALELSEGCSVQCPFCGFSPDRLSKVFRYTQENAVLFRETLKYLKNVFGTVAGSCPCYMATEPFDNPDYEKFIMDYESITGCYPQTTTATAERNSNRIKNLIKVFGPENLAKFTCFRFSIRTKEQFLKIMDLYTPEELLNIEILTNNPESVMRYSNSGNALENNDIKKLKSNYSISCVAGVKINFASKTIQYIEPETPNEKYPKGYRVFETATFTHIESLKTIINEMLAKYMLAYNENISLAFNRNISILQSKDSYIFKGDNCQLSFPLGEAETKAFYGVKNHTIVKAIIEETELKDKDKINSMLYKLWCNGYLRTYFEE